MPSLRIPGSRTPGTAPAVTSAGISTGTVTGSGSDHGSDMARGDTGLRGSVPPSIGPGRHMAREYGFCPHVVVRRKALVLEDVRDYPRFAGNPVVDEYGIRSYLGAPSSTARASR